jgi:hypothetical protein
MNEGAARFGQLAQRRQLGVNATRKDELLH